MSKLVVIDKIVMYGNEDVVYTEKAIVNKDFIALIEHAVAHEYRITMSNGIEILTNRAGYDVLMYVES